MHGRAYVAGFNFKGSDQQKKVGDISGGERNRLHLAKALLMGGNVLLLDEPTNDLDVDTLRALEEALLEFPGCAVVITHDRWFLDRIATHVLAFEGDSEVVWFEGNFSDYERDRKKRLGADADQPHRIHYKKLTRLTDGSGQCDGEVDLDPLAGEAECGHTEQRARRRERGCELAALEPAPHRAELRRLGRDHVDHRTHDIVRRRHRSLAARRASSLTICPTCASRSAPASAAPTTVPSGATGHCPARYATRPPPSTIVTWW